LQTSRSDGDIAFELLGWRSNWVTASERSPTLPSKSNQARVRAWSVSWLAPYRSGVAFPECLLQWHASLRLSALTVAWAVPASHRLPKKTRRKNLYRREGEESSQDCGKTAPKSCRLRNGTNK